MLKRIQSSESLTGLEWKETGIRSAMVAGLISLLLYLSGFFVWLTPLPIIYAYKNGRRVKGLLAVLVAILTLTLMYQWLLPTVTEKFGYKRALEIFFWLPGIGNEPFQEGGISFPFGILYYGFFALMAVLLGEFEARVSSITRLVGQTAAILMFVLGLWLFWYIHGDWIGLIHQLEGYFSQILREVTQSSPPNEEVAAQVDLLKSHIGDIAYYFVRIIPAMVVNMTLFVIWLNIVMARKLFVKKSPFFKLGALRRWHLTFICVWIVIGLALLFLADIYLLHTNYLRFVAINGFFIFGFIYFFQGLSIVVFYSVRWSISPLIRFLFYGLLLLFFQPLGILIVAFGFFDSWFDFRRLVKKPASS